MMQSGTHEQHPVPAAAGRRCQLLTCAAGAAELARQPLLARTRALLGQHDGRLSASWLAIPPAASRLPRGRQRACRGEPGKVTAVAGTREPARTEDRGYTLNNEYRLPESEREEYRARVAERKSRAEKVLPGSPEAEAVMLLLKSGLPTYVKDSVLMVGLAAYLDFTDIAAKAGYTRNWEATEVPMDNFFREGSLMTERHIQVARARWFNSICKLPLRPPRAESRSKKKAEVKAEAPSKGFGGAAAAKGFGGGEAKPSRGRKKRGAASAAKKLVKSQDMLLYEVEVKARAREQEREQEEFSQYLAWVESKFGPMTDTTLAVFLSHKAFWDMADNLYLLAVSPTFASASMGCSMEYCMRLLRSLRFAYVVSTPMRLRDASEASKTPKEERMSQGQGLLSGVGTALRDALSFRKGAAAASASEATERDVTLEEIRQTSQEERDQRLLASLEVEDLGKDAESMEATPLRRYLMVEALLQPGFKWWAERPARLRALANAGALKAAPSFPMTAFPEDALLGGASMPESPAADVSGFDSRGGIEGSSFAPSPIDGESAETSDQSLEAIQAPEDIEEQPLVPLEQLIESEAFRQSAGSSVQLTEALQASMDAEEQAAEGLVLEQSLEASETQSESSQLPLDASQQPYQASAPSLLASETAPPSVDQSLDSSTVSAPPEQSLEVLQEQVKLSQAALQASQQALEALKESSAASQRSLEALDQPPSEAAEASAEASMQMPETLQQANAGDSKPKATPDRQGDSAEPAEYGQQARATSEQESNLVEDAAEDRQQSAGQSSEDSLEASTAESSAPPLSPPRQPQPLRQLADRFNNTAEELAQLDASAMGPRARRPPATRTKHPRSKDGWTSLPEQAAEVMPERQAERQPAFASAPAIKPLSAPSRPWQPRVRVQPPAYQGAYIAPQLLPGDRRDWKAAGVLAYTVDDVGVHLLLGRIDQRLPYAPARPREDGWWILGGKRSGADYSAEATAVREMFEETAGVLSGRDVSGGQLSEVLWYPDGGYALFPLYIPGKPDIPRAYYQRLIERERVRRRTVRRVAGPRPMSKLGWVPLNTIIERRCKLHLVLHAMMQSTPLISYLQQMQQLLSQQAALQTNPMTHPLGSPYGGPVPMVPRAVQAPVLARAEDGSSSYSRVRPPAGTWAGAATEQTTAAHPARVRPPVLSKPAAPSAESYSGVLSAAPANGSAAAGRRPPSASAAAESAATAVSSAPDQRRLPARPKPSEWSEALAPSVEASSTPSAASADGSAADKRSPPLAAPATENAASAVTRAANGSSRRRDNSRAAEADPVGYEAISPSKEGISSRELAEHRARAAGKEEVRDTAPEEREAQREVPPWERELHAPKPYKSAIIRRGRRRLKRRVS